MKTADEMLLSLGYEKKYENEYEIRYEYDEILLGDKFIFTLLFAKKSNMFFHKSDACNAIGISAELLQAIYKKCKEMGWIE